MPMSDPTLISVHLSPPQTVRMHVSIFLAMSVLLLVLVVWFIGELQKAMAEQKAEEAEQKSAHDKKAE